VSETEVGRVAKTIIRRLQYNDGEPAWPVDALKRSAEELMDVAPEERQAVLADLIALALRLQRESRGTADVAVAQLLALAGVLMLGDAAAQQAFRDAGVEVDQALKFMDRTRSIRPVERVSTADPGSVFGLFAAEASKKRSR